MNPKKDIQNEEDIKFLIDTFYQKVRKDDVIGHIFNEVIGDDWSKHLPIMYSFWETVLLGKVSYKGNAIRKHVDIDRKMPLEQAHYQRWLLLWDQTTDQHFSGTIAEQAKKKAATMMQLIEMKVVAARDGKSIL